MEIQFEQNALTTSSTLFTELTRVIAKHPAGGKHSLIIINYRDSTYNTEAGGYHPVEIAIQKDRNSYWWSLCYITDFSYQGSPYPELAKELDFDFSTELFSSCHFPPCSIYQASVKEMYQLWESNFLCYLDFEAYDQVEVTLY